MNMCSCNISIRPVSSCRPYKFMLNTSAGVSAWCRFAGSMPLDSENLF